MGSERQGPLGDLGERRSDTATVLRRSWRCLAFFGYVRTMRGQTYNPQAVACYFLFWRVQHDRSSDCFEVLKASTSVICYSRDVTLTWGVSRASVERRPQPAGAELTTPAPAPTPPELPGAQYARQRTRRNRVFHRSWVFAAGAGAGAGAATAAASITCWVSAAIAAAFRVFARHAVA